MFVRFIESESEKFPERETGRFVEITTCFYRWRHVAANRERAAVQFMLGGGADPRGFMNRDVVLVTGGNSGIGFECARHLARQGWHVLIASRNREASAAAV